MFVGSKDQNVAPEAVVRAKATVWSEGHKKNIFCPRFNQSMCFAIPWLKQIQKYMYQ